MGEVHSIVPDRAKTEPESYYRDPEALVAEGAMTRGEKLAALRNWEFNVQRRMDSLVEGMAPEPDPDERHTRGELDEPELLRRIRREIEKLRQKSDKSGKSADGN